MDSKPLPDVRRRWVPLSAVPASAPQATLELEYGTKKRSHIKALFVLWGDVLFYWPKGSKRIDYNIGRILVDRSRIALAPPVPARDGRSSAANGG